MDIIRDLYAFKGHAIRVTTDDGTYEGILINLCSELRKLSLAKVVSVCDRAQLGNGHFFAKEINSYDIISETAQIKNLCNGKNKALADLEVQYNRNQKVDIAKYIENVYDDKHLDTNGEVPDELKTEGYVLNLPDHLAEKLPDDHIIIDELDRTFDNAIRHILDQKEIGVSFEGENLGRFGELWLVSISTTCCTFIFDIYVLKHDAFDNGLKKVFESTDILKVIHDCRQPSDILYHKYNIKLENIFDTQVGDSFADMQNSKPGPVRKRVEPLYTCLIRYLRLTDKEAAFAKTNDTQSAAYWMTRPMPNSHVERAIKSSIFLRLLKDKLTDEMMRSYHAAVNLYLRVVRNASVKELELEPSSPNHLPEALLSADLKIFHMKDFPTSDKWDDSLPKLTIRPLTTKPKNGRTRNRFTEDDINRMAMHHSK